MKKIIFVTGTRADYGKIKSLIRTLQNDKNYKTHIFVTGMHNLNRLNYRSRYQSSQKIYNNDPSPQHQSREDSFAETASVQQLLRLSEN